MPTIRLTQMRHQQLPNPPAHSGISSLDSTRLHDQRLEDTVGQLAGDLRAVLAWLDASRSIVALECGSFPPI